MNGGVEADPESVATLDMCYVLHADHGMNASTFASRVTVATLSDIYSGITSAIGTLKGPLHGGANEAVIRMLQEIGSLKTSILSSKIVWRRRRRSWVSDIVFIKFLILARSNLEVWSKKMGEKIAEPKWIQMSDKIAGIMQEKKAPCKRRLLFSQCLLLSGHSPLICSRPFLRLLDLGVECSHPRAACGQSIDSPSK